MPEESTTPDLLELADRLREAANRRDVDSMVSFFTPDAVMGYAEGLGTFEGRAAIRRVWQDTFATFEELWLTPDETLDLGNGVVFSVAMVKGRPVGSSSEVRQRTASVNVWAGGLIERSTLYLDIDEARAAAERLAEERG
jgi:ketosteroid isomerase-like protein